MRDQRSTLSVSLFTSIKFGRLPACREHVGSSFCAIAETFANFNDLKLFLGRVLFIGNVVSCESRVGWTGLSSVLFCSDAVVDEEESSFEGKTKAHAWVVRCLPASEQAPALKVYHLASLGTIVLDTIVLLFLHSA